jgi:DNA repair exonuclease SbcCD ATPase subunit
MKIKSVYIDGLHNAVNKTYEFGDIVYIFGHNGAGKSTILQAIQFALLGYIPGTNKTKDAILRHSPKNNISVKVTLLDGDNEIDVQRNINKNGNFKTVVPETYDIDSIIKDLELPIFNFNEFVGQTANKLKEYFIKNILPTVDNVLDWEKILSDSIADCNFEDKDEILKYGMSLIPEIDDTGEILNQVIQANAKFKEEQSFNKSEIQRLQNTIDSLIYYDDYVGPTDVNKINSELLSLGALRDQMLRYESARQSLDANKTKLDSLKDRFDTLGGDEGYRYLVDTSLPAEKAEREDLIVNIERCKTKYAQLKSSYDADAKIIASKGICPYTQKSCEPLLSQTEELAANNELRNIDILELQGDISKLEHEKDEYDRNIKNTEALISEYDMLYGQISALEQSLSALPDKPNTDKTLIELNAEIDRLTEDKSKLQANLRYNATIEDLTNMKYETELQSTALTAWIKATDTNGLQTSLMQKPFEDLADTMTKYIQQMYGNSDLKAHFNVESKANSFSFGLIRNGVYIPYDMLSSGEKCLYTLALMICIVNNNSSPLKVMLLDDAFDHLDSNAIESTFATLKNVSGIQFIFAGVKECSNAADIVLTA